MKPFRAEEGAEVDVIGVSRSFGKDAGIRDLVKWFVVSGVFLFLILRSSFHVGYTTSLHKSVRHYPNPLDMDGSTMFTTTKFTTGDAFGPWYPLEREGGG